MSAASCEGRLTVFVDRDGTINCKAAVGDYVKSPEEFAFLPGAKDALRDLSEHATRIIIVTNQRGVALGRLTEADLAAIHARMLAELDEANVHVDAIYYCPHDYGQCSCRKPGVGMFLRAKHDHPELVLRESIMIGDSVTDIEAAARLGLRSIFVSGKPCVGLSLPSSYRATSLRSAVSWVTGRR